MQKFLKFSAILAGLLCINANGVDNPAMTPYNATWYKYVNQLPNGENTINLAVIICQHNLKMAT